MPSNTVFRIIHLSDLHLAIPQTVGLCRELCEAIARLPREFQPQLARMVLSLRKDEIALTLREDLEKVVSAEEGDLDAAYTIITGDICTWPYMRPKLDVFYGYLCGGSFPGGLGLGERQLGVVTGNHDHWTKAANNYIGARFDQTFHVREDNVDFIIHQEIRVVLFTLRTSWWFIGPGRIEASQFELLRRRLDSLESGESSLPGQKGARRKNPLSQEDYRGAVKVLVIHHSPLHRGAYSIDRLDYGLNELRNRGELIELCQSRIDIVLCGHMHQGKVMPVDGVLVVNAGTCMAENPALPGMDQEYNFHILNFLGDHAVVVDQYFCRYAPDGSPYWTMERSTPYRRTKLGYSEAGA